MASKNTFSDPQFSHPEQDATGTSPSISEPKQPHMVVPLLGGIVLLGILALSGTVLYRLGQSNAPITPSPTLTPYITPTVMESTPSASPAIDIPTITNTSTPIPTSTPTQTQTPTVSPTNTQTPTPVPQADLYISEFSFNHPPKMGEVFTAKIGLYNKGNTKAGAFWWEWWPTPAIRACRVRVADGLVARGGIIVHCTYTYGGWSTYTTKAIVDVDSEVSESDEENNTHTETVIPSH